MRERDRAWEKKANRRSGKIYMFAKENNDFFM